MTAYLVRRLFHSIFVLTGLIVVVFVVTHQIGDPAQLMLPVEASQEQYLALRAKLGLDDPLHERFGRFFVGVLQADFGESTSRNVPALPLVLERLPPTLYLTAVAMALALPIALLLGIISALKPHSIADRLVTTLSVAAACVAEFWMALMLIFLLAVSLGLFRTSGYGGLEFAVLPALALAGRPIGRISQVVRTSMLDEMGKGYVTTARSKGLSERIVVTRHALKNAAIPVITLAGDEAANLLQGAVVVEAIFAWPGVGSLLMHAISRRDLPLLEATAMVIAGMVIVMNLLVDLTYAYLNPRVRLQ